MGMLAGHHPAPSREFLESVAFHQVRIAQIDDPLPSRAQPLVDFIEVIADVGFLFLSRPASMWFAGMLTARVVDPLPRGP